MKHVWQKCTLCSFPSLTLSTCIYNLHWPGCGSSDTFLHPKHIFEHQRKWTEEQKVRRFLLRWSRWLSQLQTHIVHIESLTSPTLMRHQHHHHHYMDSQHYRMPLKSKGFAEVIKYGQCWTVWWWHTCWGLLGLDGLTSLAGRNFFLNCKKHKAKRNNWNAMFSLHGCDSRSIWLQKVLTRLILTTSAPMMRDSMAVNAVTLRAIKMRLSMLWLHCSWGSLSVRKKEERS